MFGVTIGNGAIISCDRICPDVAIQLPGVILRQDFFAFDMGTAELVLGVRWLASLDTVEANWKELFLTFRQQGRENSGADALSRRPHSAELLTLVVPFALDFHQWKNALLQDPFTAEILKKQNSTTPFKIFYGCVPPALHPFVNGEARLPDLEEQLVARDHALGILKQQLLKVQSQMTNSANSHHRDVNFEEGDLVFLRLQPYRQKTLARRSNQKLAPRFFGPYVIKRRIGKVAYELELPAGTRIHPMFHVSLLKPARGHSLLISTQPPPISDSFELAVQPEKILAHRWKSIGGIIVLELLIQWANRPTEEASWEEYDMLQQQFPNFQLEDKSNFLGGCNDTVPTKPWANHDLITYTRRKKPGKSDD
ncbi:hypothetical protein V2J09_008777 [Rumex salicifolius]